MLIELKSKAINIKNTKNRIKISAIARLAKYKYNGQEKNLDKYLRETYNTSLFDTCMQLTEKFKLNIDKSNNELYISFDKDLDKIASLITYGNLQIKGSNILRSIFRPIF